MLGRFIGDKYVSLVDCDFQDYGTNNPLTVIAREII